MRKETAVTITAKPGALSREEHPAFFLRLKRALLLGLAAQGRLTQPQLEACLQSLDSEPRDSIRRPHKEGE